MKTKLICILSGLLLCSCGEIPPDEEFTMTRTPYTGEEIRLDGCYVSNPNELNTFCEYDFFYSNGVLFSLSDKLNIEDLTQITGGIDIYRKEKIFWGVFQVKHDTVEAQTFKISENNSCLKLNTRVYKIINDTTLSIDLLNDGDVTYYHFKHFLPKPDSTNIFIK